MKDIIKEIAEALAREIGPQNITLALLCEKAGISQGSFQNIMGLPFSEFVATLPPGGNHKVTIDRAKPVFRKKSILMAAVELAWAGNYTTITRDSVAEASGVSGPSVLRYFKTIGSLKEAVMLYAIEKEIIEIIAQGIVCKNRVALAVPARVKKQIAKYITG